MDLWNEYQIKEGLTRFSVSVFPTTRKFITNYLPEREDII
jgi:hypothetical protein